MGMVFLTGYMTEELMREEHYAYYVKVMTEKGYGQDILPPHGGSPATTPKESAGEATEPKPSVQGRMTAK